MADDKAVVEQAYEAFGRGDIGALLDLLHDDVEWLSPKTLPQGGVFHGKSEVGNFFAGVGAAWDPLAVDIEGLGDIGGGLVVGVIRGDGTLRGGDPSGYGSVHVFTVRDGRISRFREYTDLDAALVR